MLTDWSIPVIAKRLKARHDWLNGRWGTDPYRLLDAGDGCKPVTSVKGAVAFISEGGCSFFTKIKNMDESNVTGVLVYALPGNPIQDMNCIGDDCSTSINIPASMVHVEPSVMQALRFTFNEALQEQLSRPAVVIPVFDRHLMQGETGAQAVVDLPGGNYSGGLYPFKVMSLFPGGTFDKDYNSRYQEIKFSLPV
ncbi:hypothetical protein QQF64_009265 [Cirrhinus molitorella]|uniref:PA domain-containing protein n=1 Tax=Cirrhinus molitorella TaxID=172907 RepID=A0ABR3M0P6_9TELE